MRPLLFEPFLLEFLGINVSYSIAMKNTVSHLQGYSPFPLQAPVVFFQEKTIFRMSDGPTNFPLVLGTLKNQHYYWFQNFELNIWQCRTRMVDLIRISVGSGHKA